MKKTIALCLCLLILGLCFAGCQYIGITDEYELYDKFAKRHDAGMTKQEIYDELGCPDAYYDQAYHNIEYNREQKKAFEENLSSDNSTAWYYHCAKYGDSDYYNLYIKFDSEGRSVKAEMTAILGG